MKKTEIPDWLKSKFMQPIPMGIKKVIKPRKIELNKQKIRKKI